MTTSGPDPLGKRALFWAPAQRDEDGPAPTRPDAGPGRRALFSATPDEASSPPTTTGPTSGRPGRVRHPRSGPFAVVEVDCSRCGSRDRVDLFEYASLHLPFFLWRPGRGFTRWMRCPSCRRRTWISASWASWPR